MVDIKQIITYLDMFGTKNTFYTDQKPKLYTLMGGIFTLLSFIFCIAVFLFQSLDDFKRTSPITSTSYFHFDMNQCKIKFGEEKIWIPWRIADYNNNYFINHTDILFPIIYYYTYEKKENNSMISKRYILNYKLCNETSMKKHINDYILNVPINELYCIEMDDLDIGGSWTTDFVYYIQFDLYYCKNGIDYNENNPNCTPYDKLMNISGIRNSLYLDFYFPEVQYQPANLLNPIILKYNQYYYHLSRFSNKIDRLYLQKNILIDDFGWIVEKNKNYSYWGKSKAEGETRFTGAIRDLVNEGSTSRAYSINIYVDSQIVYYKRYYKKINAILSENFPIVYLIYLTIKKMAQMLKIAEGKEKTTELLFDKLNDKTKVIKIMKINQKSDQSLNFGVLSSNNNQINLKSIESRNQNISNKFIRSDKSRISLMRQFDNQKNPFNNMNELVQNRKEDNYISQIIDVPYKTKTLNKLFPFRYYLFSEFIRNIDISKYYRCCFSTKYTKVYKFIGKLFDISSYLILQREFNILKNYTFKQKELNMIEQNIKINLNDHTFMRDINDCIGGTKFNIFAKNIKNHKS